MHSRDSSSRRPTATIRAARCSASLLDSLAPEPCCACGVGDAWGPLRVCPGCDRTIPIGVRAARAAGSRSGGAGRSARTRGRSGPSCAPASTHRAPRSSPASVTGSGAACATGPPTGTRSRGSRARRCDARVAVSTRPRPSPAPSPRSSTDRWLATLRRVEASPQVGSVGPPAPARHPRRLRDPSPRSGQNAGCSWWMTWSRPARPSRPVPTPCSVLARAPSTARASRREHFDLRSRLVSGADEIRR